MKKIRLAVMAIALVAGASGLASAQGGGNGRGAGRQGGGNPAARYFANTSVATDSAFLAKAGELITAARTATMALSPAPAQGQPRVAPDSATALKITEINNKRNADLRALLTKDEDKKAFDTNVAAMTQGRRGGGTL